MPTQWLETHCGVGALGLVSVSQAMNTISAQTAGDRLDALINEVVASGEPVLITGMESKAVLISEEV